MYFNMFNMQQRPLLRVFSVLPSLILSLHIHRGFRINYIIRPKNPIVYVHGNIWQNMCKHRIFQAKKSVSRHNCCKWSTKKGLYCVVIHPLSIFVSYGDKLKIFLSFSTLSTEKIRMSWNNRCRL